MLKTEVKSFEICVVWKGLVACLFIVHLSHFMLPLCLKRPSGMRRCSCCFLVKCVKINVCEVHICGMFRGSHCKPASDFTLFLPCFVSPCFCLKPLLQPWVTALCNHKKLSQLPKTIGKHTHTNTHTATWRDRYFSQFFHKM